MALPMSLPPFEDVSETITIKNTFVDWVTPTVEPKRRCSSVPRSWVPGEFYMDSSCGKSVEGEDSTTASDKSDRDLFLPTSDLDSLAGSDKDFLPGASTPSSSSDSEDFACDADSTVKSKAQVVAPEETPASKPVMKVKLLDFVGDAPPLKGTARTTKTKLRAAAQPFASFRAPPAGIQMVIQAAKDVLESDPSVVGVQVLEGTMGGTCTMVVHTGTDSPHKSHRFYVAAAKNALLTSAEHSQDTYIMGYDVKPFAKIDKYSFSATLANIPACQHSTACWDSYKNGFCPRRITCRWTHPCETQVMRLVFRVQQEAFQASPAHEEE